MRESDGDQYTWDLLHGILDEGGGAVYILKIEQFKENVSNLLAAFQAGYSSVGVGYSYKTNYLPRLCREAHSLGFYAEVVSGMEYEMARHLHVPGDRIIFNGPSKTRDELLRAFTEGALVNIDSLSEAAVVADIAKDFSDGMRIGLRCNLDLTWNGRESRFGLSGSSGELWKACELLRGYQNVEIEGLHCHTSFSRSAESYRRRIERLIEIADQIFTDAPPRFLDVGGGLCGPMAPSLAAQLKDAPPSYTDYAEAICAPMRERYGDHGPELIVEPGVGLVGNVFDYAYRVEHVKQVGSRRFAMTSGAAHQIKIVPNDINLPTSVYRKSEESLFQEGARKVDIVGFTCLEHDVIYHGLSEELVSGDILVTGSVGAYSMVTSSEFIRTTPMVVEIDAESDWKVLKRKRTTGELMNLFDY